MSNEERTAVIGTIAALVVGTLVALAGSDGSEKVGGLPGFALCAIVAYGINLLGFLHGYLRQTEHYFDLTGSVTYVTVTVIAVTTTSDLDARTVILGAAIGIFVSFRANQAYDRIRDPALWRAAEDTVLERLGFST